MSTVIAASVYSAITVVITDGYDQQGRGRWVRVTTLELWWRNEEWKPNL